MCADTGRTSPTSSKPITASQTTRHPVRFRSIILRTKSSLSSKKPTSSLPEPMGYTSPSSRLPHLRLAHVLFGLRASNARTILRLGAFIKPQTPGLGVTLDMDALEKYRLV